MARPKRSEAKAETKAAKKPGKPPKGEEATVLEALPTEDEFNRAFDRIKSAERKHEKAKAEAKEITTGAKAGLNKAYADAAVMLEGRKLSIRSLKRLYVLSNRDEDELTAEITGETWGMRALGFKVGEQLALFPAGVKGPKDALIKAERDGRDIGAKGGDSVDNPHPPGSPAGQAWLKGYSEGQASNVTPIRGRQPKPSDDDDEAEERREAAE